MTVPEERSLDLAAFRFRLIADALDAGDEGVAAAVRETASETYRSPLGGEVHVSERTLWRYLRAYRQGGLTALVPRPRKDRGSLRAVAPHVLARAKALRREKRSRATNTVLDILVRETLVARGDVSRATLDRHLGHAGLSRRRLHALGKKAYRKVETHAAFELVVTDFHDGPYVRHGTGDTLRRALLCAFIDHYSRYIPEGRYYLHEDFEALRFGLRRLLVAHGLPQKLYQDNGPAYQASRFHAACDAIAIRVVHSKPYVSEGRGVVERLNRTVKEQFEDEARGREEPLTLDELNAYFEAWLSERYHRDVHSETGETPLARFSAQPAPAAAPELAHLDELLRLRERRKVHKKWSTIEVRGTRYLVDRALRGRRVDALFDPFDPAYVLVVFDGRVVERAFPQAPGVVPSDEPQDESAGEPTDYLALLRADYEKRTQAELHALRLAPRVAAAELSLVETVGLVERCRGALLTPDERTLVSRLWRKLRPLEVAAVTAAFNGIERRMGHGLHVAVYLEALTAHVVRLRTPKKGEPR